jgi:hypothetical protein
VNKDCERSRIDYLLWLMRESRENESPSRVRRSVSTP